RGGTAFRELVERAQGFFDYYLSRLGATHELATDKGRLAVLRAMSEAVHKTGNRVLIDKYAQKTALRLGVSPDAVRAEFEKLASTPKPRPEDPGSMAEAVQTEQPSTPEYWILKLLLQHEDLMDWATTHLVLAWIQHALVHKILDQR